MPSGCIIVEFLCIRQLLLFFWRYQSFLFLIQLIVRFSRVLNQIFFAGHIFRCCFPYCFDLLFYFVSSKTICFHQPVILFFSIFQFLFGFFWHHVFLGRSQSVVSFSGCLYFLFCLLIILYWIRNLIYFL